MGDIIIVCAVILIIVIICVVYTRIRQHQIEKEIMDRCRKDKEQKIEQTRQNARENQELIYNRTQKNSNMTTAESKVIQKDLIKEMSVIRNCPIEYPENITGYCKTYKTYEKVKISSCINWDHDYFKLLLNEPLTFAQEGDQIVVYQKSLKIGYISSEKIVSVINDFLQKESLITGFLYYINPNMNEIKISIAYYENLHNQAEFNQDSIIEELKVNAKLKIELENDTIINVPLTHEGKDLCYVDEYYRICIMTNNEPDYSKLKLGGKLIFKQEPNNSYDHKAVKIKQGNRNIGYLYRGEMQDKVNFFINSGNIVTGYLTNIEHNDKVPTVLATILLYN